MAAQHRSMLVLLVGFASTLPLSLGAARQPTLDRIQAVYERRVQDREPLLPFAVFQNRNFTLMVFVLMAMGFPV